MRDYRHPFADRSRFSMVSIHAVLDQHGIWGSGPQTRLLFIGQAGRDAIFRQLEGWLHDLKFMTLMAYRYKVEHDFFNRMTDPFDDSDECPTDVTDEQRFQYENNW